MFERRYIAVLLFTTVACGGGNSSTTSSPSGPTSSSAFTLTGQVTDSATGAGISGATLAVNDGPNAGKSTTTDASGNYSLAGLQQSGFTVNVSATTYASQSKGVTLTSNQTLSFQLQTANGLPSPPSNLAGTSGTGFIVLTWTDSPNASSYNVYRQTSSSGFVRVATGVPIRVGSLRQAGLTSGTAYSFYMTSVNAAGESAPSNIVTVTPM
jgi:hypothetical protein